TKESPSARNGGLRRRIDGQFQRTGESRRRAGGRTLRGVRALRLLGDARDAQNAQRLLRIASALVYERRLLVVHQKRKRLLGALVGVGDVRLGAAGAQEHVGAQAAGTSRPEREG